MRGPLASLRAFATPRAVGPRCDLCRAPLGDEHPHLLERGGRVPSCACPACALLFASGAAARFLAVPPRAERLPGAPPAGLLARLGVPVELAFVVRRPDARGALETVAVYPSALGPVESVLDGGAWEALAAALPSLATLAPEVEAALFTREAARVLSIDRAYALAGLVRARREGLTGGVAAARAAERCLALLESGLGPHAAAAAACGDAPEAAPRHDGREETPPA